jgi:hypothetical protein
MLKRLMTTCAVLTLALTLGGCAFGVASYRPGGAMPGLYADQMVFPGENQTATVYQLTSDDFEIRATVEAEGDSSTLFGILSKGDNGYRRLIDEARRQGCDDVINIRTDVEVTNVFFLYIRVRTYLTGTGIKWK